VVVSIRVVPTGIVEQKSFLVPNNTKVAGVNIDRSILVKRERKLTFAEGVLTESTDKKPSEAAEAAKLPLTVTKAIFAGINEALGALTGLSNENEKALKAKQTELEQAKSLSDTVIEIEKSRKQEQTKNNGDL